MLRDVIASHAGLGEAIVVTAPHAPMILRAEVERLATESERFALGPALAAFGDRVADPIGDLVVAALRAAVEGQANDLPALLSEIAVTARADAGLALRIEAGRARTHSSTSALSAITIVLSGGLALVAPTYMAPYAAPVGQLVLCVVGVLFAAGLFAVGHLDRTDPLPRALVHQGGRAAS